MGDPFDNVDIGPMVSLKARDEVHNQVTRSIDAGAILVMGGFIPICLAHFTQLLFCQC